MPMETEREQTQTDKIEELRSVLFAVAAWLSNGHRGAHGEPVSRDAMLEVIETALL